MAILYAPGNQYRQLLDGYSICAGRGIRDRVKFGRSACGTSEPEVRFPRHMGPCHAPRIVRPTLGQKQLQTDRSRRLARCQRHGDQRLAVGGLSKCGSISRRNVNRVTPLPGQCGVVNDQPGTVTASQLVRPRPPLPLRAGPHPKHHCRRSDEADRANAAVAHRNRLNALAITRTDQSAI